MRQSQQVLEWQEEARREGVAAGRQQGLAEGRIEERADGLIRLLRARFPAAIDPRLEATIRSTRDLAKLAEASVTAAVCFSIEQFRRETGW